MDRVWVTEIRQTAGSFQWALVAHEEAALIERQIRAALAANQAKSVTSAAMHVERASCTNVLLIQAQVQIAARPCEAVLPEAVLGETTAHVNSIALPNLLLLLLLLLFQNGVDVLPDSRAFSSKTSPASYSIAIMLDSISIGCCDLFLFFLFLHLYDFVLK